MSKKQVGISHCRVCNSKNLTAVISFGDLFLSDYVTKPAKPPKYQLNLVMCKNCTLVQLRHTTPQSELYTEHYGYKSGINQTMQRELSDIVEKSLEKTVTASTSMRVVDIGANDGTLLKYYPKHMERIGVEPIKTLAKECNQHADIVINDFFTYDAFRKYAGEKKATIVTAISCFYDMEKPNEFVADVKKILDKSGVFVIQQNYLVKMLTQNAFDNVVHEHLEYYSLLSLQNILKRHGLEVFEIELRELNGGSFRTFIGFQNKRPVSNTVLEQIELEKLVGLSRKKVYTDFAKRVKSIKNEVYEFINTEVSRGKTVYLYGASTRGNTLLQYFKLNNKLIKKAVDRNPKKWGKQIASSGIPIISEEQARNEKPDYLLVLPWYFKDEFISREKAYLKKGGHFIFPLPRLTIV